MHEQVGTTREYENLRYWKLPVFAEKVDQKHLMRPVPRLSRFIRALKIS